jgi:hypothetical protein
MYYFNHEGIKTKSERAVMWGAFQNTLWEASQIMKGTRKPSLFFIGLLKTLLCCTVFLPRYTTLVVTSPPSPKRWRSKGPCML